MKRFLAILTTLLFLSIPGIMHAGWMDAGSFGGKDFIFLDDKIKPVGKSKKDIYPHVYTLSYRVSMQDNGYVYSNFLIDLQSGKICPLPGKTEMSTVSNHNVYVNEVKSIWEFDGSGMNHWTFAAYLWKNHNKIDKTSPYILSTDLQRGLEEDRTPRWKPSSTGWLQAYNKSNGSKAWIQTKSIVFTQENSQEPLPSVELLVRYATYQETSLEVTYSFERYNPNTRLRTILYQWQEVGPEKTLRTKQLPIKTTLPVYVPNDYTTIATTAFIYDLLYARSFHLSKEFPPFDNTQLLKSWFAFEENE